jgi:RNA polymerase sigma-70 factor (ECF subfamily)
MLCPRHHPLAFTFPPAIDLAPALMLNFALATVAVACYVLPNFGGRVPVNVYPSVGPDDTALLRTVASRDKDAFQQLYDRHAGTLFALALKILGDRTDAEDVLQETFVQVWRAADTFDEQRGKPLGWLIMLARSRAIDRRRSRQTRARAVESAAQELPDATPHPEQEVVVSESHRFVRDAINALPEEQRSLIELAYFGGLTQSEIARRVGQPLGTVKTRIRAGMMRLRELLDTVPRKDVAR